MSRQRRAHSAEFKFKVALEAAKGRKTLSELASELQVRPNQISEWKRYLLEKSASVFERNGASQERQQETREAELYEQIGHLKNVRPCYARCSRTQIRPNGFNAVAFLSGDRRNYEYTDV